MPPFALHPLSSTDAPTCATIYFSAFQNAHSLACWPRTPSIRTFWEDMISSELEDSNAHCFKAVETSSGEIAGWCKWVQPKHGELPDETLPKWPEGVDAELCDETFGAWAKAHREVMGSRGHWYLEIVAVNPSYQGRGIGSRMMEWGTSRADQDGVEVYLEASPEAVRLYERFGFREVGKTDTLIDNERVKNTKYQNLYMLRPAPAGHGASNESAN